MVAARGRDLGPGGLLREIVRLVVLVAVGFGLGLLFGVATDEPELLAGHLRGESESVELAISPGDGDTGAGSEPTGAPAAGSPATPRIGSAREAAPKPGKVAATIEPPPKAPLRPRARPSSEPTPPTPAVAAAPRLRAAADVPIAARAPLPESATAWAIQVGAFSDETAAAGLADSLRGRFPVEVLPAGSESRRWRVRVQPIASEAEARETAERLKRDERLPTWVTRMESR